MKIISFYKGPLLNRNINVHLYCSPIVIESTENAINGATYRLLSNAKEKI